MSVCIRYMAGTITVCLSDKRLHVQVRVHEAGVGAGASASCQGLTLLLSSPPLPPTSSRKRFRPNCVPALSTVVPPPPPLPACPLAAHLPASEPEPYPSLQPPPKPARELKPGPPATLVRCTHTSLSLLSIISITINRSAPLTCTPSHRITAHTHAIESMLMLILGCHTTDLQVFSCPRILPVYSYLVPSFALSSPWAASGQDTQKGPPAPPVIVPCVSSSPCLLPTALAILPSRHPTDGLHLLLGSSFNSST